MFNLGQILTQGYVELEQQAHLVKVTGLETSSQGKPYFKAAGVSPVEGGGFAAKLILNIFPDTTDRIAEIMACNGSRMFVFYGDLSVADTTYGTEVRSIGNARVAEYGSDGTVEIDGSPLSGEPGTLVTVEIRTKACFQVLETIQNTPAPGKKTINLKERHEGRKEMRKMGAAPAPADQVIA
jgi:hypothetical protein